MFLILIEQRIRLHKEKDRVNSHSMSSASYFPVFGDPKRSQRDVETGDALYPGIGATEQLLRVGCVVVKRRSSTWTVS